jgi:hypothetical protein
MATTIEAYRVELFRPETKFTISQVMEIIKQWKEIRGKKINKTTTKYNLKCDKCNVDIQKLSNYIIECTKCGHRAHVRSLTVSLKNRVEKIPKLRILRHVGTSIKCRQIYPKSISIQTYPVVIAEKYLKSQYANDCLQYLSVPHPIFWQSRAVLCLIKLLNLIADVQQIKNCEQLSHYIDHKYGIQFPRFLKQNNNKTTNGCHIEFNFEHENSSFLAFMVNKLYKQFQDETLNYGSLNRRKQGKNSNERKLNLAKRCLYTARAMILPCPQLKPNELAIPYAMWVKLFAKKGTEYCVINRMPSLYPENFSGHKIAVVWDKNCIGIPDTVMKGHNADFDGDEMNLFYCDTVGAQLEIYNLLNSERNMWSGTMQHGIKLYPSKDMQQIFPDCAERLAALFSLYGSRQCFRQFVKISQFAKKYTTKKPLSINIEQLENIYADNMEQFEKLVQKLDICANINSSVSVVHLWQAFVCMGHVYLPDYMSKTHDILPDNYIKGNLYKGLSPYEQLVHSQSGFCNMVCASNDISEAGYLQHKLCHNLLDVLVDRDFNLVEGGRLITKDLLRYNCIDRLLPKHALREYLKREQIVE